jgi:Coenzyme PQQ synthesis protein D (PqqD)
MNDKYIVRSTAVAARELGGEMIIMSAVDSTLFSLNETATAIWRAADGRTRLSEIVDHHICHEFEVEPEQAYRDAVELVEQLARLGILQISDKPASQPSAQPVLETV